MKKIAVLYHNDCFDGFTGAWAAWKKFGKRAEYIGVEHQENPPTELDGRVLFFIDFTYSKDVMVSIKKKARSMVVLDHHKSHADAVKVASEYRFSLTNSGCMLAWKYFHPDEKPPVFLEAVQDQDLFVFKKPYTREIISYLATVPQNFTEWSRFMAKGQNAKKRKSVISQGELLLKARDEIVQRTLLYATEIAFEGYRTLAINSPIYYSELANKLYSLRKAPFGVSWYIANNSLHVSLRSNGTVDVSKIAVKYGGGGHRGAAGFKLPLEEGFPWKFL